MLTGTTQLIPALGSKPVFLPQTLPRCAHQTTHEMVYVCPNRTQRTSWTASFPQLMFRNAYRRFPDGRESLLNNFTVKRIRSQAYVGSSCDAGSRGTGRFASKAPTSQTIPGAGWVALRRITRGTLRSVLALPALRFIRKSVMQADWLLIHLISCQVNNIFLTAPAASSHSPTNSRALGRLQRHDH